jgi:hypothetical protein
MNQPQKKQPVVRQPHTLRDADSVHTYNKMVDALSAYRDTREVEAIEVPERFEEPKFVPKCVCGNDDNDDLSFFQFQLNWIGMFGYDKRGLLNVEHYDDCRYHTPEEPSIREDQVGLFLYCRKCEATRKITDEEYEALGW